MPASKKSRAEAVDLSFRPASYFGPQRLEAHLAARITGNLRRHLVQEALDAGEDVPAALLQPSLDEGTRRAVTSLHPALLGGEFQPEPETGEVEIARVSLASTTSDQVVVRARRAGRRIKYSVHDEYDGEYIASAWRPRSSARPLTLRQLSSLITSAYDLYEVLDYNIDGGADVSSMRWFVTVTSPFYPQLQAAYARWIEEYLASKYPPDAAENDEADEEGDEDEVMDEWW